MHDIVEKLTEEGYAVIRNFLSTTETEEIAAEADAMYREGLKHHATYRDKNLLFEVLDVPRSLRGWVFVRFLQ